MMPALLLCLGVGRLPCPNFIVVAVTETLRKSHGMGQGGVFQLTIPNYSPSVWEIKAGIQEAGNTTPTVVNKENKGIPACFPSASLLLSSRMPVCSHHHHPKTPELEKGVPLGDNTCIAVWGSCTQGMR